MNKNVQRNLKRLSSKVKKITNSVEKGLGKEILDLYSSRKVSQFVNAERIIDSLRNGGDKALHKANIFILSLNFFFQKFNLLHFSCFQNICIGFHQK